ncbi:MAG: DUF1385 domain-containing protein [Oscillospiraceae bacterium]|jgi:uncharacterized protein YqhQ|nr:DUF1385 domain-containing protein [Oscillospiraceae bacterium]
MKESFKTSIGGQALIEGVMMRGPGRSAMAVRKPGGEIDIESWETKSPKAWYRKTPFVRGIFNMVDSLIFGYKCLMKSAEKAGFDDEQPSKFEVWLADKMGKHVSTIVSGFALVVGIVLAVGLFMVLPTFIVGLFAGFLPPAPVVRSLIEGVIKIGVFILYLALVSRMKDIRRVFEYHGAEHKTIACYEAGRALTVDNIRPMSRFHPRCGTSFMLIVLVVSIILFSVVTWNHIVIRVVLKIALLPAVVGIAYEIIKFAGRHDNALTRTISAPGMWLQRLTTFEPHDDQIEVAVASMQPCIPGEKGTDEW